MVSLLKLIITLGIVQGAIAGGLLFWGKRNQPANRYLAVMIWFFSLACLNLRFFQESTLYTTTLGGFIGAFVPLMWIMPLGPLFYFYIRASMDPDFQWKRRYRVHWISTFFDLAPQLSAIVYIGGILLGLVTHKIPLGEYIDVYNVYVDIPRWLSFTGYLWAAHRFLLGYHAGRGVQNDPATARLISVRWLRQFIWAFLGFQVLWLVFLIPYVWPGNSEPLLAVVGWYPIYVPLAILIYWVGIKALLVTYQIPMALPQKATPVQVLTAETVGQSLIILKKAMDEEQLYLDPDLSLSSLSKHTGIAPKTISAVLNQHQHSSFNEFINGYRIRAFQQRLQQADLQTMTITGIAFDCGFNSQATFQRAFKQVTGMSPTEYRKTAMQG